MGRGFRGVAFIAGIGESISEGPDAPAPECATTTDSVSRAQEAQRQADERRRAEEQRQRLAEACPAKPITGPVPATLACDLCPFITEAAATEGGNVLIILVTHPMADAITLRSVETEEALIGMGARWMASSPWAVRLEVYYGRVHLATVSALHGQRSASGAMETVGPPGQDSINPLRGRAATRTVR